MPSDLEIFPYFLRVKGVALSTCSNWLNNFILVNFPLTFSAVFCALAAVWIYFFVPETNDRADGTCVQR
ncbi:hypothetical protein N7457_006811 [Penicillium paradoxum]|uniref:uncharacterized protein n=1 Tax=Penicillium paradoxum TaxID=176176 RepID=UPI002546D571|nr:uncharacterized protein N7457_006811 [Penicillium paradoxum]KAJ5779091.1 hypothetical protein N7457_006811 [Penicillium paradoxum]